MGGNDRGGDLSIRLRGHHLLCLLGFRGMGYSEAYAKHMGTIQDQLRQYPATEVTLCEGADDLCAHFPDDQPYHCDNAAIRQQDRRVLEQLGLRTGETLRWEEVERRVSRNVQSHHLDDLCTGCQWLPYGVCKDGVLRIQNGEGLLKLSQLSSVPDAKVIEETREWVHARLGHEQSGHDTWHAIRVWRLAKHLATHEGGNLFIIEMAALLHDIIDDKVSVGHISVDEVKLWLHERMSPATVEEILEIITSISFRGGNGVPLQSLEAKIVQDADRLDSLGAIGIARTFMYSGFKGQAMYDPDLPPRTHMSFEEYRHGKSTAINHFYEKLLTLKSRLNTVTAKALAEQRHTFMTAFVEEFLLEWEGQG